jgi:hypothetical protein
MPPLSIPPPDAPLGDDCPPDEPPPCEPLGDDEPPDELPDGDDWPPEDPPDGDGMLPLGDDCPPDEPPLGGDGMPPLGEGIPPLGGLLAPPDDDGADSSLQAAVTASANPASRIGLLQAGSDAGIDFDVMVWPPGGAAPSRRDSAPGHTSFFGVTQAAPVPSVLR